MGCDDMAAARERIEGLRRKLAEQRRKCGVDGDEMRLSTGTRLEMDDDLVWARPGLTVEAVGLHGETKESSGKESTVA
ncbi:hypothetical protein M0R45_001789 [Rubus argutus]|uniref:Uncharacterized protein n=1 Tax=Rubus argutus TaxID=59490 RepID=A0AAW1VFU9_RUBAR